jgi:dsRNA-specific ribonuclease
MIGEQPGPFPVAFLAEAFLGEPLSPEICANFATQVEATGILKRDDHHRAFFQRVPDAASCKDEELAQALKQENPKGKLNELCLGNRWTHPKKRVIENEDGNYCCLMTLEIEGKVFETSRHEGESKILVEQLASRELLEMIAPFLAAKKEAQAQATHASPPQPPVQAKPEEMEAAASETRETSSPQAPGEPSVFRPATRVAADFEAKATLNHYRQKGWIKTLEFHMLGVEGPAHAPVFTIDAEAALPDGTVVRTDKIRSATKKEAQILAAQALLDLLSQCPSRSLEVEGERQEPKVKPSKPLPNNPDEEILSEIIALLRVYDGEYNAHLPFAYFKWLARQVFQYGKVSDEKWIQEQLIQLHTRWEAEKTDAAKKGGYYPFVQFTLDVYRVLVKQYGEWSLEMMRDHLDDPIRIFPKWAAQFAGAMNKIGREECNRHLDDLYKFVTGHQAWEESADDREKLHESITATKLQRLRSRFGEGASEPGDKEQ